MNLDKSIKIAKSTPVLYTTYNRLSYTKKSLPSLIRSTSGSIIIFDNNSSDGTKEWLNSLSEKRIKLFFNDFNGGVSASMNYLFFNSGNSKYIAKVDNDTVVEEDWLVKIIDVMEERGIDIVQARHPILKTTHFSGNFDEWMKEKEQDRINKEIYYNDFVGGSGVVIRRSCVNERIDSHRFLGGWDDFQFKNPNLKKAFFTGTSLKLFDHYEGEIKYSEHPEYYQATGRFYEFLLQDHVKRGEQLERDTIILKEELSKRNSELSAIKNTKVWKIRDKVIKKKRFIRNFLAIFKDSNGK